MARVEIHELRKSFGEVEVLHGLNAEIPDGEFLAVLGESGCGKSTLLRIVAGLEDATSGEVVIDGHVVNALSPRARDIAMVFQSYALYPHMTVAQNISFPLELSGLSKSECEQRVIEAAEMLNLSDYLDRKPRELSGGQRQRVAMGRAIVRNPVVFLFDEPLSNLDAKLRVQMRSEIRSLQHRLGTTAIYVTHDQVEAMTMADRVMIMNGGRIEQVGPPLELYDRPASRFVAEFIGAPPMNLIDGAIRQSGQNVRANLLGTSLDLTQDHALGPVTFGIRPEHFRIAPDGGGTIQARVNAIENTGDRVMVSLDVGSDSIAMTSSERLALAEGETVPLTLSEADLHIFDQSTGLRL